MADNIAVTAGSGTTIATDNIGGVNYQRTKVVWGVDGTATDASATNPLPVTNASTFAAGGTPTGTDYGNSVIAIRDDTLSSLSISEGLWAPLRVDAYGGLQVNLATGLSASLDSVAIGSLAGQGASMAKNIDVDETEDAIKASTGTLLGYYVANLHASSWRYVKLYNLTVASVVVGTSTPVLTLPIPAASAGHVWFGEGVAFSTAITVAATTAIGDADTGAPGTNEVVFNAYFK